MDDSRTVGIPTSFILCLCVKFVICHQSSWSYNTQKTWQSLWWGCNVWCFTVAEAICCANRKCPINDNKFLQGAKSSEKLGTCTKNKNIRTKWSNLWKAWQNNAFSNELWIARNYRCYEGCLEANSKQLGLQIKMNVHWLASG